MSFNSRISQLKEMIANSQSGIGFFGGAGVSTASGIPDFRSKDGLYNNQDAEFAQYDPEFLLSHTCLYNHPKVFFEYYRKKLDFRTAKPNVVHQKLAELEHAGIVNGVITQNIDGLHQKAGSNKVYEIHGSASKIYCSQCGKEYTQDVIFETTGIPRCECDNILRPNIVLYGEILPTNMWNGAIDDVLKVSDTLIVAGTSLLVHPATLLMQYFYGPNLIIINQEETPYDSYADLIFRENMTEVFSQI